MVKSSFFFPFFFSVVFDYGLSLFLYRFLLAVSSSVHSKLAGLIGYFVLANFQHFSWFLCHAYSFFFCLIEFHLFLYDIGIQALSSLLKWERFLFLFFFVLKSCGVLVLFSFCFLWSAFKIISKVWIPISVGIPTWPKEVRNEEKDSFAFLQYMMVFLAFLSCFFYEFKWAKCTELNGYFCFLFVIVSVGTKQAMYIFILV